MINGDHQTGSGINTIKNSIIKKLGSDAGSAISGKTLEQLEALDQFLSTTENIKMYKASFPSNTPYPDNPVNKLVASSGLAGRSCGELYGTQINKLRECDQLVKMQQKVIDDVNQTNSIYSNFSALLSLPDQIRRKDPLNYDIALETKNKQEQAFYRDVANVYGIQKNDNGQVSTQESGLSARVNSYHQALAQRNQDVRERVLSQAKTLQGLRQTQQMNQDLGLSLQDNMYKIEKDLSTKTRLIQINEEAARQKNRAVITIAGSSASIITSVLAVIFYMAGTISLRTMLSMFIMSVAIIVISLFVVREQPQKEFVKLVKNLDSALVKGGDELNMNALEWVDKNCDCPDDSDTDQKAETKQQKKAQQSYQDLINHLEGDSEDGIWYDDGSGPPQNISMFHFQKGTGKNLLDVSEGDNANVYLTQHPNLMKAKRSIKNKVDIINNIASEKDIQIV